MAALRAEGGGWRQRVVRGSDTLTRRDYQLCYVEPVYGVRRRGEPGGGDSIERMWCALTRRDYLLMLLR